MATFTGDMKLMGYVLTHTLSGNCNGSIVSVQVSASTSTTPPYLISWSGTNSGHTATTFDISNLCADDYVATLRVLSWSHRYNYYSNKCVYSP
jgi:hypothetical protein